MFGHVFLTTYASTTCLIIIAELTLFIDVSHFEVSIMVALTSMLVMYTLYQSISQTLLIVREIQKGKKHWRPDLFLKN